MPSAMLLVHILWDPEEATTTHGCDASHVVMPGIWVEIHTSMNQRDLQHRHDGWVVEKSLQEVQNFEVLH